MLNAHSEWLPILNAGAGLLPLVITTLMTDNGSILVFSFDMVSVFAESIWHVKAFCTNSSNGTLMTVDSLSMHTKIPITDNIAITPAVQWASNQYELTNR